LEESPKNEEPKIATDFKTETVIKDQLQIQSMGTSEQKESNDDPFADLI
jgi:hypothetical protein